MFYHFGDPTGRYKIFFSLLWFNRLILYHPSVFVHNSSALQRGIVRTSNKVLRVYTGYLFYIDPSLLYTYLNLLMIWDIYGITMGKLWVYREYIVSEPYPKSGRSHSQVRTIPERSKYQQYNKRKDRFLVFCCLSYLANPYGQPD